MQSFKFFKFVFLCCVERDTANVIGGTNCVRVYKQQTHVYANQACIQQTLNIANAYASEIHTHSVQHTHSHTDTLALADTCAHIVPSAWERCETHIESNEQTK